MSLSSQPSQIGDLPNDPRTTQLYDRRRGQVTLDEVERVLI